LSITIALIHCSKVDAVKAENNVCVGSFLEFRKNPGLKPEIRVFGGLFLEFSLIYLAPGLSRVRRKLLLNCEHDWVEENTNAQIHDSSSSTTKPAMTCMRFILLLAQSK